MSTNKNKKFENIAKAIESGIRDLIGIAKFCRIQEKTCTTALDKMLFDGVIRIMDDGYHLNSITESGKVEVETSYKMTIAKIRFANSQNVGLVKKTLEFFGYKVRTAALLLFEVETDRPFYGCQCDEDLTAIISQFCNNFTISIQEVEFPKFALLQHLSNINPILGLQIGQTFNYKAKELQICAVTAKKMIPNDNIFLDANYRIEFQAVSSEGALFEIAVEKNAVIMNELKWRTPSSRKNWESIKRVW